MSQAGNNINKGQKERATWLQRENEGAIWRPVSCRQTLLNSLPVVGVDQSPHLTIGRVGFSLRFAHGHGVLWQLTLALRRGGASASEIELRANPAVACTALSPESHGSPDFHSQRGVQPQSDEHRKHCEPKVPASLLAATAPPLSDRDREQHKTGN